MILTVKGLVSNRKSSGRRSTSASLSSPVGSKSDYLSFWFCRYVIGERDEKFYIQYPSKGIRI